MLLEYTLEEELELMREEIIGDAIEQVRKQTHGEFINQCNRMFELIGSGALSVKQVAEHSGMPEDVVRNVIDTFGVTLLLGDS